MDEQTVANRIKSYIPPELRGIPQALRETVTPYIPPELRPYSLAAKQAGDLAVAMNPITMAREMTGKSGQFFDSGGKDYQAGLGALLDTALLSAGPIAGRIAYGAKEPMKAGLRYMQDLFYPLGASDEVAEQAVKIADPSKRDFMKKAGTAGILSVVPAVRGIEEIMPTATTAKAVKASPAITGGVKEVLSIMQKYDDKLRESVDVTNKGLGRQAQALEEDADFLLSQMRMEMDDTFKKHDADGKIIVDKQGNIFNKVLDSSEKQAVKEMFENMSDIELGRIADDLVDDDSFLHPDVLDNFLKQVTTRSIDEKSLNPERYSAWMTTTPEKVVEKIKENPFVVEDTEIGRQAREVLENY